MRTDAAGRALMEERWRQAELRQRAQPILNSKVESQRDSDPQRPIGGRETASAGDAFSCDPRAASTRFSAGASAARR